MLNVHWDESSSMEKVYLGDGVYATFNGFEIILTTEDGINISNKIYLDPHVMDALVLFYNNKMKV